MELHQLRYVLAVARAGNFSRAAESCHVAQPSLCQQVHKLEDELGERLFTRLKRQAIPTAAGRMILARASRILGEVEAALREVMDTADEVRGTVNLGVLPTIAPYLLPVVLTSFREQFPHVEIIVHERTTAQLLALCAACELDFAVLSLPITDDRFQQEKIFTEDLLLAVPPNHRLARRREVRIEDVEAESFILLQEGHCLGDQALRFCDRQMCHPPVIFRTAQLETIRALVAAGMGVSLIPRMASHKDSAHEPVYVSIRKPQPTRAIAALWRKEYHFSRAATALLELMRTTAIQQAGKRTKRRAGTARPARAAPL